MKIISKVERHLRNRDKQNFEDSDYSKILPLINNPSKAEIVKSLSPRRTSYNHIKSKLNTFRRPSGMSLGVKVKFVRDGNDENPQKKVLIHQELLRKISKKSLPNQKKFFKMIKTLHKSSKKSEAHLLQCARPELFLNKYEY
mmetsp:Transcript_25496/g.22652  ORF Transcript_25496/g.22652 Transcript_25496/m.22652 type:complete len:142 (+) Transcript_25496:27-452(+)